MMPARALAAFLLGALNGLPDDVPPLVPRPAGERRPHHATPPGRPVRLKRRQAGAKRRAHAHAH